MKKLTLIFGVIAIAILACNQGAKSNNERVVYENYGTKVIKVRVDSIDYIIATNYQDGIAIIRHSK